jgi:acyl-coenzyme A synthetase/AMP-(fatty) acid ligase
VKDQYLKLLPNVIITDAIGSSETGFTGLGFVSAGTKKAEGPTVTAGPSTIVIDEHNRPVGPGEVGRIARGGHIPLGYFKDPVKTAALFAEVDGARYAVPGDFARVEEDGTITLLGRGNTCVNTGGEKVFPEEVEGALKSFASIFDAMVIGVPDELLGQRVAALVQPREGHDVDLAALDAHLRTQIAGYKVPRSVWIVEEIGRTPAGKADHRWAHRYAEEHEPASNQSQPA